MPASNHSFVYPFKSAWWLTNKHGQTIAAKYLRRSLVLPTVDEILELPDNDFIELSWTELPNPQQNKPIVVILHGLAGSKESHYAKGIMCKLKSQGYIAVLMHFRGCGKYPNRQGTSYHSGDTRDISYLSELLTQRIPQAQKMIIGYSLGGNVLANYLATNPSHYKCAAIVCAPLHLASCSARINQGMSKIYQKYLIDMLKAATKTKIDQQLLPAISHKALKQIKTMWQFDQAVTAPINGFKNADDYYQQASGRDKLPNISIPCLIIHAKDDPFLAHDETIKMPKLPPNITLEICQQGGHVGFITGNNPFKPIYWLEQRIPYFFQEHL